jgi:ribose transport system substrate-binding protein
MRRWTLVLALCAVTLAGCSSPNEPEKNGKTGTNTSAGATGGQPEKKFVIGMSQCNLGEPWRVQMNKDVEEAAKQHPNIEMIFRDAQNRSETQQSQVREFIQQKVDLIIISPKEARPLTRPVEEAMQAGIPVIVLDRKIESNNYTQFIGADNVKIGREAGKYLVKVLGGKGDVVELKGLMTSTPGQERHNGFMEGIAGSQIKVIFDADCQWLEPNAQREMKSALSRFPKIDAVYGHNDPSAHGAFMAARQEGKGREKQIKFIGIDALPHEGVRYVKDGVLSATFEYPTGGKEAIENALKILKGEKVEKNITLGTKLFTNENIEKGGETL